MFNFDQTHSSKQNLHVIMPVLIDIKEVSFSCRACIKSVN